MPLKSRKKPLASVTYWSIYPCDTTLVGRYDATHTEAGCVRMMVLQVCNSVIMEIHSRLSFL
jgi:hypothetical protein